MSLTDAGVEERIDRVLTQYRESPKLLHLIRTYLAQVVPVRDAIAAIPDFFDIDTAVGDQLTLIGKRLGWPREHPVCNIVPSFGFECDDGDYLDQIAGFCEAISSWESCGASGFGWVSIDDDGLYRKFLQVRVYQMQARFDLASIEECVAILWGETAMLLAAGNGRIVVAPGRELDATERTVLQLYPRVMPTALGIETLFHFGELPVFGFGEGWEGFCEPWQENGLPLQTTDSKLVTEDGDEIFTGPLTRGGLWMCETDVKPYDC